MMEGSPSSTPRSGPPGPRGHPIAGSRPEFRRDVLGFFQDCARTYGDISAFRFFHIRCLLVNHPELVHRVLVELDDRLLKSWEVRRLKLVLGDGLLTAEGAAWRRQRRLANPAFHGERIRAYAGIMTRRAEEAAGSWRDGEERDVHEDLMRLTLRIVAESLFGLDVRPHVAAVEEALGRFMDSFEAMLTGVIPPPLRFLTPSRLRAYRAVRRLDRVIYDIIETRRARSGDAGDDLLAWLLEARYEDGSALTDREVRDQVVTLMLAGHETTAIALSWTLYLLGRHPEVEARARRELAEVLGGRCPTAEDVPRLTYTRQVIDESMRLYPPAWGLGRETREEVEIGGYRIPRGTQVFVVPWVTHRDPRFFPDPERFDPDRWTLERRRSIPRFAYYPFGAGPRKCIGAGFATMEATLLLASLLQRCRFELVADHPIELQPAVTLRPRHGIRAVVHHRTARTTVSTS